MTRSCRQYEPCRGTTVWECMCTLCGHGNVKSVNDVDAHTYTFTSDDHIPFHYYLRRHCPSHASDTAHLFCRRRYHTTYRNTMWCHPRSKWLDQILSDNYLPPACWSVEMCYPSMSFWGDTTIPAHYDDDNTMWDIKHGIKKLTDSLNYHTEKIHIL